MPVNINYVIGGLVALALIIFFIVPSADYNIYLSGACLVLAVYLYMNQEEEIFTIPDPMKLLEYARNKPSGKVLVDWISVKDVNKQTEYMNGYWFYSFNDGYQDRSFLLNTLISKAIPTLTLNFSQNANQLSKGAQRKMAMDIAWGMASRKSEQDMISELEKKGYKVVLKNVKHDEKDD